MDARFKGKLGYAVAADAWGQLEKAAVGNVTGILCSVLFPTCAMLQIIQRSIVVYMCNIISAASNGGPSGSQH